MREVDSISAAFELQRNRRADFVKKCITFYGEQALSEAIPTPQLSAGLEVVGTILYHEARTRYGSFILDRYRINGDFTSMLEEGAERLGHNYAPDEVGAESPPAERKPLAA